MPASSLKDYFDSSQPETEVVRNYKYRGHQIKVVDSGRGPFWVTIEGPACYRCFDTYSLAYLERCLDDVVDRAIARTQEVSR